MAGAHPASGLSRDRRATVAGTVVALVYAIGYVPVLMFLAEPALLYYLGAPIVLFGLAAVRGGVPAAFWAGCVRAVLTFAAPMLVHLAGFQLEQLRRDDIEPGLFPDPVTWFPSLLGQDLGSAFFGPVWLPLWALVIGIGVSQLAAGFRRSAPAAG